MLALILACRHRGDALDDPHLAEATEAPLQVRCPAAEGRGQVAEGLPACG